MMGISLGYFLSKNGMRVHVYEASPELGGLAGRITLEDGTAVDRFAHEILPNDKNVQLLCTRLGLDSELRFRGTKTGFYYKGEIYPMNGLLDFVRFPPLSVLDRTRLGLAVLRAQMVRNRVGLESINVEDWLVAISGHRSFEIVWRPLLNAQLDGGLRSTPAAYIRSRLKHFKSTFYGLRQEERVGYLIGGFSSLVEAMAARIVESGGSIHVNYPADEIMINDNQAWGVRNESVVSSFDLIVSTVRVPIFRRLIPDACPAYKDFIDQTKYLDVISPLLVLNRPLSDYRHIYVSYYNIPFTDVINTTSYIDPAHVEGRYLVYLPKYITKGSIYRRLSDDDIRYIWLQYLKRIFPQFNRSWIQSFPIIWANYVEPMQQLNGKPVIPEVQTPIKNLCLCTSSQVYPSSTNCEAIIRHAQKVADLVFEYKNAGKISNAALSEGMRKMAAEY